MPRQMPTASTRRPSAVRSLTGSRKPVVVGGALHKATKLQQRQGGGDVGAKRTAERPSRDGQRSGSLAAAAARRGRPSKGASPRDTGRGSPIEAGNLLVRRRERSVIRQRVVFRIAMDVAVSRLQRWARVMLLRRRIGHHGVLATRIAAALEIEECLWKLRVRMAKRVLLERLYAYVLSLRNDSEAKQQQFQAHAVTTVNALLRTFSSCFLMAKKRQVMLQGAVRVLEKAWMRCSVYKRLQQFSFTERVHWLLVRNEEIERRDYVRRRWLFLVECHQRCYNHPLLMEAGVAVRHLDWHERVIMDGEHTYTVRLHQRFDPTSQDEVKGFHHHETTCHGMAVSSFFPRVSLKLMPVAASFTSSSSRASLLNEEEERVHTENLRMGSEGKRFCRRADASFLHGLLCEKGHLDFGSSMGTRPCPYELPQESADCVVHATCTARLQNTTNALEVLESRFVCVAGALVRGEMQSSPLVGELRALIKLRERGSCQDPHAVLVLGNVTNAANSRFLHPKLREKYRKDISPFLTSNANMVAMGRSWAAFFRAFELNERLHDSPTTFTSGRPSPSTSEVTFYRRRRNQLFIYNGSHVSLQALVGLPTSPTSLDKFPSLASVAMGNRVVTSALRSCMESGRCYFDIKYLVACLLIREYHRRWNLIRRYEEEILSLTWLIQREQSILTSGETCKVKDTSGEFGAAKSLGLPASFSPVAAC